MFLSIVQKSDRKTLVIDCAELLKNSSDAGLVNSLAAQTGYWPVFTFLNNFNTWIDLASVGIIGQKAGLATSLPTQVQQVLSVVGGALANVSKSHRANLEAQARAERLRQKREQTDAHRRERIQRGEWHDGRLDCVAGNGVMSELGIGDEPMDDWGTESVAIVPEQPKNESASSPAEHAATEKKQVEDLSKNEATLEITQDPSEKKEKEGWRAALPSLPNVSLPSLPSLPSVNSLPTKIFGSDADKNTAPEEDSNSEGERRPPAPAEAEAVRALPILVIKNFAARTGVNKDAEEVLSVISTWAASLAENQVCFIHPSIE
jgi:hypothetical protein